MRSTSKIAPKQKQRFVTSLAGRLDQWRDEFDCDAYGILIRHRDDIYSGSSELLAERELDNRYISMLWSLIEHCVFVNEKISRCLTDDAGIHLHIANRAFLFRKDEELREIAKSLRWQVREDRNDPSKYVITSVLSETEIRGMFRMTLRNRWKHSRRHLASVDISSLNYEPSSRAAESSPALYLADILLGVERRRMFAYSDRQSALSPSPLPILESLSYDRHLDASIQCTASLQVGGVGALVSTLENHPFSGDVSPELRSVLVKSFRESRESFHRLFEIATKKVDHPTDRIAGQELAELLETVYRDSGLDDLQSEFSTILIPFSAANHTGDTAKANELWDRYLVLENRLPELNVDLGMEFGMQFRCRRAVNLMDQFRFREAEEILVKIGAKEEDFRNIISEFYGANVESVDRHRLGMCYSTLAQACAFQSYDPEKRDLAEDLFRNALSCFESPNDRERILVYLGHLACDFPETGRDLWSEVETNLFVQPGRQVDGLEKPFVLAVLLKGILVFGDPEQKKNAATFYGKTLNDYPDHLFRYHPYGLILQCLGLLNIELWKETKENGLRTQSLAFLEWSRKSLDSGGFLLRTLASVAGVRRGLFLHGMDRLTEKDQNVFSNQVLFLEKRLGGLLGGTSSCSAAIHDRAETLLKNIRFNYW